MTSFPILANSDIKKALGIGIRLELQTTSWSVSSSKAVSSNPVASLSHLFATMLLLLFVLQFFMSQQFVSRAHAFTRCSSVVQHAFAWRLSVVQRFCMAFVSRATAILVAFVANFSRIHLFQKLFAVFQRLFFQRKFTAGNGDDDRCQQQSDQITAASSEAAREGSSSFRTVASFRSSDWIVEGSAEKQ